MSGARVAAWVTLAGGAALGIAGAALVGNAYSIHDDVAQALDGGETLVQRGGDIDSGRAQERAGAALLIVGGAALATSVVLFVAFDARRPAATSRRARVPRLAFGPGGVTLAGQF